MLKTIRARFSKGMIKPLEKIDAPEGEEITVIFKTYHRDKQKNITDRQIKLLDKGFNLGKKLYLKREDLYAK